MHPLGVLGQQRHVGVHLTRVVVADRLPAEGGALALVPAARREVALHADDRLDPVRLGLAPELVGAEDVAVVGHRQRRHAHPGRLREQVVQPRRTVEHRELGVRVQVDEAVGGSGGWPWAVVCSVLARRRAGCSGRVLGDRVGMLGEGRQTNAGVRQFRAAGADAPERVTRTAPHRPARPATPAKPLAGTRPDRGTIAGRARARPAPGGAPGSPGCASTSPRCARRATSGCCSSPGSCSSWARWSATSRSRSSSTP